MAANSLDSQLKQILTDVLNRGVTTLGLRGLRNELELIVDFIYFRLTVVRDKPLPAHIVENVGFARRDLNPLEKRQKLLYFILMVLLPYGWKRLCPILEERKGEMMKAIDFIIKSALMGYFMYFLSGRSPIPYDIRLWMAGIVLI